jgi:two-component system CAI-1 autoinducer sensor kinase/phosphatase CqsS
LISIECEIDILRQNLPDLLAAHPADREALAETIDGIDTLTKVASTMIKMLLMNIGTQQIDSAGFTVCSMREVVDAAIEGYPYNENERDRVVWRPESDFAFLGSDLLMRHVLFNLLKNALFALKKSPDGTVEIRLVPGRDGNRLIVRDTGPGVLPELLPHLFEPFVTGSKSGEGVGIGLAFCKRVIDSFKGTIQCRSERDRFTEFVLTLPLS